MTKLAKLIQDLKKANQRLKEATRARLTRMNKDATIQRFEFTFELAWKTIQAWVVDQGFECKSPKGCIREAARLEILDNPKIGLNTWKQEILSPIPIMKKWLIKFTKVL